MWLAEEVTSERRAASGRPASSTSGRRSSPVSWIVTSILAVGALAVSWMGVNQILHGAPAAPQTAPAQSAAPSEARPTPTLAADVDSPDSLSVVVGPKRPLVQLEYAPDDLVALADVGVDAPEGAQLRRDTADALLQLIATGWHTYGYSISAGKAYVAASDQAALYEEAVAAKGEAEAKATVGQPGHSEYQTGLLVNVTLDNNECSEAACFSETSQGSFILEHAHEYGFIVRYPAGAEAETGVSAQPWVLRYVGSEMAAQIKQSGKASLESYLGLPPSA